MPNWIQLGSAFELECAKKGIKTPAVLPGDVQGALLDAGLIKDPYVGTQENEAQWVHDEDWTYEGQFEVDAGLLNYDRVVLTLTEVDTFCQVFINNQPVFECENQFKRYRKDVRSFLREGRNSLRFEFTSPVKESEKRMEEAELKVPAIWTNRVKNMNYIRKVQCHAGWDWGLCLITSGIYGEMSLRGVNDALIDSVCTTQHFTGGGVDVRVEIDYDRTSNGLQKLDVHFAGQKKLLEARDVAGQKRVEVTFRLKDPDIWWPTGYGEQPLYDLEVRTEDEVVRKKIGIRQIELISEKDEIGRSFMVRVNGVDVYCKGANWIPLDAFSSRQTPEKYRRMIDDAKRANMNMIRVWGGGQYESEIFYELCDEMGILVWQDAMFACSQYPSDKPFVDNVVGELTYQVRRLRDHACLALWCGDNEVVGALNWYPEAKADRDTYLDNYDRLNRAIGETIKTNDPTRVFWPSSPSDGPDNVAEDWHNDQSGDMHYWAVWHGGHAFDSYLDVRPRFCSEFGYQSFPSMDLIRQTIDEDQLNVTSPQMEHHQRNDAGNSKIVEMFTRYFRFPEGFEAFVYLSQVQQAMAIKAAVEIWRCTKPVCMGSLVWQLNDNWPVASWSSIDYAGNWKQLHYHSARFNAPVIVALWTKEDKWSVGVSSDVMKKLEGQVVLSLRNFKGEVVQEELLDVALEKGEAKTICEKPLSELGCPPEDVFATAELKLEGEHEQFFHRNDSFLAKPKSCELEKATIETRVSVNDGEIRVQVSTDNPVFFLTLSFAGLPGVFSDNSFTLLPGEDRILTFEPRDPVEDSINLSEILETRHLRTCYL